MGGNSDNPSSRAHEIRWNPELQEWFCARCGRRSDHRIKGDAETEIGIFPCEIYQHVRAGTIRISDMPISARNKLRGTIEELILGNVMAHVVVRVGDNLIESAITRRSAEELKLKKGDTVTAIIKATEVMIQKD